MIVYLGNGMQLKSHV